MIKTLETLRAEAKASFDSTLKILDALERLPSADQFAIEVTAIAHTILAVEKARLTSLARSNKHREC
jgi:hypothetical protein